MKHLHAVLTRWLLSTPANAPKCAKPSPDKVERARMAGPRAAAVASYPLPATRASAAAPAASPSCALDLFELDEEFHPNHVHGDDLAVLDCQLA